MVDQLILDECRVRLGGGGLTSVRVWHRVAVSVRACYTLASSLYFAISPWAALIGTFGGTFVLLSFVAAGDILNSPLKPRTNADVSAVHQLVYLRRGDDRREDTGGLFHSL